MKKLTSLMIAGAILSMSAPALAQSRAVNISVGSIGGRRLSQPNFYYYRY
ncbi:hypothetical protein [Nostoc sp.]